MNANRLSLALALSSQILFAVLLLLASWGAAAWWALSLAALALVLGTRGWRGTGRSFPRLPLGAALCFSSMAALSLAFPGDDLFPYTGLFFACGLGAASLADAVLPAIRGSSVRLTRRFSLLLGALYSAAAFLHLAFFPRPAYLYFGVGGLALVSILDIASGIFLSVSAARAARGVRSAGPQRGAKALHGLSLAVFLVFCFGLNAQPGTAQEPAAQEGATPQRTEEETFAALFGEDLPAESPEDALRIIVVRAETPDCFTEAYVLSFVREFKDGQRLSRGELEEAIRKIEERMAFSGRFYRAALSYRSVAGDAAAAGSGETDVAVAVSVSEGFWWDFNFEPYDVFIGYRNLFRSGKELQAVAGLNTQALRYRDPAVRNGWMYYTAEAGHRVQEDANVEGADYLYESLWLSFEAGLAAGDNLRLGLGAGYAVYSAAEKYFLYPDYAAPDRVELDLLGMGGETERYDGAATFSLHSSLGAYSYQRRGGLKARGEGILAVLLPQVVPADAALKATFSGDLRLDAARLLRLTLHERVEYFPRALDGGRIAEPLWADIDEGRYRSGLLSGELASLSRVTLGLDPLAVVGLGFTNLNLIPELYYEFTVVRLYAYDEAPAWAQNVGFLIKGAFSAPVNRVFSLGLAMSLPSRASVGAEGWEPHFALFLEIE